jgi:dihydroorotate dehydrogenase (NAD+) catalytic subunit
VSLEVTIATDDGSAGFEGRVSDALAAFLAEQPAAALEKMIFYNCGPAPMIHASEGGTTTICLGRPYFQRDRLLNKVWRGNLWRLCVTRWSSNLRRWALYYR